MSTRSDALSDVYARSLYELAEKAGGREKIFEIAEELEQICECARADHAFAEFLDSPIIEKQKRAEALGRIFRDRVTDLTLRFLLVLNEKGRLSRLEPINDAFDGLVQAAHGRVEVDLYTADAVDGEQMTKLNERINTALGKEAVLHAYRDPSMIGGLKLRIGDQLIDGSVATRLRRLRASLMGSGAATIRERASRIIQQETDQ